MISKHSEQIHQQFFIEDVGHFKYYKSNKILINFIDKVKLFMDSYSLEMFLKGFSEKASCSLFLKDGSQHEIFLSEINSLDNNYFIRYLNFLDQWLKWLLDNKTIVMKTKSTNQSNESAEDEFSYEKIQAHLNHLEFINFKMSLNHQNDELENQEVQNQLNSNPVYENSTGISMQAAINNLMRENQKMIERVTKGSMSSSHY